MGKKRKTACRPSGILPSRREPALGHVFRYRAVCLALALTPKPAEPEPKSRSELEANHPIFSTRCREFRGVRITLNPTDQSDRSDRPDLEKEHEDEYKMDRIFSDQNCGRLVRRQTREIARSPAPAGARLRVPVAVRPADGGRRPSSPGARPPGCERPPRR